MNHVAQPLAGCSFPLLFTWYSPWGHWPILLAPLVGCDPRVLAAVTVRALYLQLESEGDA